MASRQPAEVDLPVTTHFSTINELTLGKTESIIFLTQTHGFNVYYPKSQISPFSQTKPKYLLLVDRVMGFCPTVSLNSSFPTVVGNA